MVLLRRNALWVLIAASALLHSARALHRELCYNTTVERLRNGTISPNDPIFYRDDNGIPMSNELDIAVTLDGCRKTCGAQQDFYSDIGPRLTTWLIPILLLVGNMQFAHLGHVTYIFILHLLGDPIDSLWSMLTKAEAWNRCYALALGSRRPSDKTQHFRERATILAAIEEVDGPGSNPKTRFDDIVAHSPLPPEVLDHLCSEVAAELGDSRVNQLLRAGLAVGTYIFHVVAAFVEAVGGKSSSQPGGRIGTAMIISWLLPAVMLSNSLGGFTSRRTCIRILERFTRAAAGGSYVDLQHFSRPRESSIFRSHYEATEYHDSQPWGGAVYIYRPKTLFHGGPQDRSPLLLLCLSLIPIVVSMTFAFIIIWFTPTEGLTCRHFMVLSVAAAYLASFLFTWLLAATRLATGKYLWYIILVKDALVAVPSILLIILSSCGIFNSCWCWSSVYSLGPRAVVYLNPEAQREYNASHVYAWSVGLCLGLQFALFFIMMYWGRPGGKLLRRKENEKQEDWIKVHRVRKVESPGMMSVEMENRPLLDTLPSPMLSPNSPMHMPRFK